MKNKEIIKPNLDLELKVEVNGITKIENNMEELKKLTLDIKEYYETSKFIEDKTKLNFEDKEQMSLIESKKKIAREEKVKINKFKEAINNKTKAVLEKYNEPITNFLELKKQTIDILKDTYEIINSQVELVDKQLLAEKKGQLEKYFSELMEKENIDFITYQMIKQNVTLSASMKSLKEEINSFVKKICDELKLIETQDHKVEILVEYKKSLNVANAITIVNERFKEIEVAKAKEEEKKKKIEQEEKHIEKVEKILNKVSPIEEELIPVIETPINEPIEVVETTEELITAEFKVRATKEKLTTLIEFLDNGGYVYE